MGTNGESRVAGHGCLVVAVVAGAHTHADRRVRVLSAECRIWSPKGILILIDSIFLARNNSENVCVLVRTVRLAGMCSPQSNVRFHY